MSELFSSIKWWQLCLIPRTGDCFQANVSAVCYLTTPSLLRLCSHYSVGYRRINERMSMENRWNNNGRGKRSTRGKMSPCHFVHHKIHMYWAGIKPGSPRWSQRLTALESQHGQPVWRLLRRKQPYPNAGCLVSLNNFLTLIFIVSVPFCGHEIQSGTDMTGTVCV